MDFNKILGEPVCRYLPIKSGESVHAFPYTRSVVSISVHVPILHSTLNLSKLVSRIDMSRSCFPVNYFLLVVIVHAILTSKVFRVIELCRTRTHIPGITSH